jgi:hypothetical protein
MVPIFAVPFGVVPLRNAPQVNPGLAALLASRATEEHREATMPRDPLCYRSREEVFEWDADEIRWLRSELLAALCGAVGSVNEYTEAEFDSLKVQARARFVLVRRNGCVMASSAPMASWFAIYCVAAPTPVPERADSASLRLYGIRQGTMFKDAANWRLRVPFADSHYLWRPVAGEAAVFPASLLHEITLNRGQSDLVLVMTRLRFAHGGEGPMPPW